MFEFRVEIESARRFHAPRLDLDKRKGGVIALLTRDALHVDGDQTLVREADRVTKALESQMHLLTRNEQ